MSSTSRSNLQYHQDSYGSPATTEEKDSLKLRATNGLKSNKYKEVDYDKLKAATQEMKFQANKSLIKMKKIEKASKDTKDHSMNKQHKAIWQKESSNLNALRRRYTSDLAVFMHQGQEKQDCDGIFYMLEDYEDQLSNDVEPFKKQTIDPITDFREDLKFWMVEKAVRENSQRPMDDLGDPVAIQDTLLSVKTQQMSIIQRLLLEHAECEGDLKRGYLGDLSNPTDKEPLCGIPEEALHLRCHNEQLKVNVLQEFLIIDQKYAEKLDTLEMQYSTILGDNENGGWTDDDHFLFCNLIDQHPFDLNNRRSIMIDRMRKQWPQKSRQELVDHEDWVLAFRNYKRKRKSLINDWYRDRKQLLVKAEAVFHEADAADAYQRANIEYQREQHELCEALYKQVEKWREEKLEALTLQQSILDEEMRRAEDLRKREEGKERLRRDKDKTKIVERRDKIEAKQRARAEEEKQKFEELQLRLAEQAAYDLERIAYRDELEFEKKKARHERELEKQREEEEKEARLEALREKVRIKVEADPYRIVKDTQNWHNRRKDHGREVNIHQPLFDVHTFTSSDISSDPRVKLETRLRQAGLHNTDYARQIMSKVEPIKPARKDTMHTHKFGDS